ncbi:MAG: hypothetical protein HOZ81_07525, partial [Streptomyces sp.]|nr:hypothetical protein [Streptomyces sp.]NUS26700.1 hypothetical protein [Streptomyces sp.]
LVGACRELAGELRPFVPGAAERIARQVTPVDGTLPEAEPLFVRLQERT